MKLRVAIIGCGLIGQKRLNLLPSGSVTVACDTQLDRAKKLAARGDTTFVVTNNHFQGKGVVNALQLIHLLTGAKVNVPEPLRNRYPELDKIASQPPAEPSLFPPPKR